MAPPKMFRAPDPCTRHPLTLHQQLVEFGSNLNLQVSHYLPGEIYLKTRVKIVHDDPSMHISLEEL